MKTNSFLLALALASAVLTTSACRDHQTLAPHYKINALRIEKL